jgi:aspartate aminotransferase, cytoplasmic
MKTESIFKDIKVAPSVEIFELMKAFNADKFENKVNLGVGVYRTDEGKSCILPFVKETELEIANDPEMTYDYLPLLGLETFFSAATKLLMGEDSVHIKNGNCFGFQALSGTGGVRSGAEFLHRIMGLNTFYYSKQSWDNHPTTFTAAGFTDERTYTYYDYKNHGLDFEGLMRDLKNAPERSVIILQVCGHNPTGVDPTREQWKQIADVLEEKNLFPFFDAAYHGFGNPEGDPDVDVWPVRYFADRGFEFFCSQSFAKNFGIYNIRCGALTICTRDVKTTAAILSQMALRVYFIYESPPAQGVRIISRILNDPVRTQQWREALKGMAKRIAEMRQLLLDEITQLKVPGYWGYITQQRGMFTFIHLSPSQIKYLLDVCHIYIVSSGRLNVCGLNKINVKYVAKCFYDVVVNHPELA